MRTWNRPTIVLAAFLTGCGAGDFVKTPGHAAAGGPTVPPVRAYLDGQEIRFIHTEASDAKVPKQASAAGVSLTGGGSRVASLGARGVSRADTPRRGLCHLLRTGGTSLWAAVERARQ